MDIEQRLKNALDLLDGPDADLIKRENLVCEVVAHLKQMDEKAIIIATQQTEKRI